MKMQCNASCQNPAMHLCAGCGVSRYCGKECQKSDWITHARHCSIIQNAISFIGMGGEKRGREERAPEDDLFPKRFDKMANDPKMLVLEHLWRDYEIEIVLAICEAYPVFSANYPNPNRGGVIGELLQRTNPRLRKMRFPFLSYEILTNLDKPWNFNYLSINASITPEVVVATRHEGWSFKDLSENTAITMKMVERFPDLGWNWSALVQNPSMPPEFILANKTLYGYIGFWDDFSRNPAITLDFVEKHRDYPWRYSRLPFVTEEFVKNHPEIEWDYGQLSRNPNMSLEFAIETRDRDWYWAMFSLNPSSTPETVEKYPDFVWNWNMLSYNPSMTPEFIEKHADKNWYWLVISRNTHLTGEFVWKSRKKNLNWTVLRYNKTVMDYLKRNHWEEISSKFYPKSEADEYSDKSLHQGDTPLL